MSSTPVDARHKIRRPKGVMATRATNTTKITRFAVCLLVGSLLICLLAPEVVQETEAKKLKLKEKKAIKSLVKGLIFKNLSTRKNFLPLPVPIPGKWQQILTTIIDSGVLSPKHHHKYADRISKTKFGDDSSFLINRKSGSGSKGNGVSGVAGTGAGKKVAFSKGSASLADYIMQSPLTNELLFGSLSTGTNQVGDKNPISLINGLLLIDMLTGQNKFSFLKKVNNKHSHASISHSAASVDMDHKGGFSRLAAAEYASMMIKQRSPLFITSQTTSSRANKLAEEFLAAAMATNHHHGTDQHRSSHHRKLSKALNLLMSDRKSSSHVSILPSAASTLVAAASLASGGGGSSSGGVASSPAPLLAAAAAAATTGAQHHHHQQHSTVIGKLATGASSLGVNKKQKHSFNDPLVMAFNLVKLAQQIRKLDASNFLNSSKKSLLSSAYSSSSNSLASKSPPLLSMNINNRKSLMNKLNYIHKLTLDLNHRHRS